jgi:hypothetical protein
MYREWKEMELCWFGDVQRMKGNRISKRLYEFGINKTKR